MSTFKASNGARIDIHESRIDIKCTGDSREQHFLSNAETEAAREFFQRERDEELGRWRWPENPDYVVVPNTSYMDDGKRWVNVYDERRMGQSSWYCSEESDIGCRGRQPLHDAAHDYFKAHPERKPWEDAKPGEVWMLTLDRVEVLVEAGKSASEGTLVFWPITGKPGSTPQIDPAEFTDGRRIWPEEGAS